MLREQWWMSRCAAQILDNQWSSSAAGNAVGLQLTDFSGTASAGKRALPTVTPLPRVAHSPCPVIVQCKKGPATLTQLRTILKGHSSSIVPHGLEWDCPQVGITAWFRHLPYSASSSPLFRSWYWEQFFINILPTKIHFRVCFPGNPACEGRWFIYMNRLIWT